MKIGPRQMIGGVLIGAGLLGLLRRNQRKISFDEKIVLVTGGSRGLGLILAELFAREGAHVVLCARKCEELERAQLRIAAGGGQASIEVCDLCDADEVEEMIQSTLSEFGRIDVIVNNAGMIEAGPVESMGYHDFLRTMDTNFWGTFHTIYLALPYLKRGARILNVTSIGATLPVPHLLPYVASKHAALGLSSGLAVELRRRGIYVTTALPGLMRTGSFLNALFKGNKKAEMTWFTMGATMPVISMNAERAARQMIDACRHGRSFAVIGLPAKAARLFQALLPRAATYCLGILNRMLPKANGFDGRNEISEPGRNHRHGLAQSPFTALGDRAARKLNETAA